MAELVAVGVEDGIEAKRLDLELLSGVLGSRVVYTRALGTGKSWAS
jgi:hypothetical protein